jgi:PAS domain S-box-containing protein
MTVSSGRKLFDLYRLVLVLILISGFCLGQESKAKRKKKNILVVHSYQEGLEWTDGQNQGIKNAFSTFASINLSIEYLDSKRIPLENITVPFAELLRSKYKGVRLDAIIVSDDNALNFLAGCHKELFPGVPVIFCGINNYTPDILTDFEGLATGVIQTLDPGGTIDLIQNLQPHLSTLAVVSGTTPTARAICNQVKEVLDERDNGFDIIWLDGLDTETLQERLGGLTPEDAVLLCNFNRDAKGVYYSHKESAWMITQVANAPVYAMEDHYLGTGVVGGYMNTSRDQGRQAARICLDILIDGEIPEVDMNCPNRAMFDYRAMERFGLDADLLPDSATVINQDLSFYDQHNFLIQNVILVFGLLMLAFLGATYGLLQSRRSERKLRISEENLRTTLDSIGDAVITTDTKGVVVRMNPVAQQITGWNIEEACGRPLEEVFKIYNTRTKEPVESPVHKVLQLGEVVGLANHTELNGRDGREHQISDSAAPIKDDSGKITGVVLVFRDVTEDYKIRKALQESERQYRLFAENSGDLIWTCKGAADNFAMTYINPAVEGFLGYTAEEYLALPREKRVTPESIKVMDDAVAQMKQGVSVTMDIKHIHKNGYVVECELWAKPLFDEHGGMSGYQGRTINISARKRAERRLAEINAGLVDLGPDYGVNVNALAALCGRLLNGTFALYNRLQGGLLCSVGQWNAPLDYVAESEPEGQICYDLIRRGEAEPLVVSDLPETEYARSDPKVLNYGLNTYVGYPAVCAGEVVGALCVVYQDNVEPTGDDLRILGIIASALAAEEDRKRAGEELRRMQKLEELGTVAGGIAHDFNNLLTGIFGNLELAQVQMPADSPAASFLQKAFNTIENARGLTGQLLTFAEGGAPSLDTVNTAELIRESVDFNLHGGNVRAEYDLQKDLWPIQADKGQIGQVIANLVVNAKQAMPNGGIVSVTAANVPGQDTQNSPGKPREMVCITIRDEGMGIPGNILDRIFDPYFTTRQEGHGLGLSVVQSIIDQHKGWIDVDSSPGKGAAFRFYLPALPDSSVEDNGAPDSSVEQKESLGALHVLLMDDEEIIRKLGKTMIGHMGYTVDTAVDGDDAIEKYSTAMSAGNPYGIVIMDLTIRGGKGGEETVGKLLEIDPDARVIVASGYASDPVMANYSEYGFSGKLAKPYALAELQQVITQVARA